MPSADPDNARCERGAISRFVFHVGLEWHEKSSGPHAMVVSFRGIRVLCSARAGPPGPCSKDARKTDCFYKFYGCTSQKVRRRRRQIQVTRGSLVHLADRLGHQVTGSRTTHDTNQGFEITHVASVKLALQGTIARPPPPPPTHSLLLIDCGGGREPELYSALFSFLLLPSLLCHTSPCSLLPRPIFHHINHVEPTS